jgi:hypothetical protein
MLVCAGAGCAPERRSAIEIPAVNPTAAAAKAIELYDKDANGSLSAGELAACPGMLAGRQRYDANHDGQLSHEEIAARITTLFSLGLGLVPVRCTVTRGSVPLGDAVVRFVPDAIFEGALKPATGTTDGTGTATISIPDSELPADQHGLGSMQPGIYRVEIEHPSLRAATSPLGCEVDPSSRGGTEPVFNL